VNYCSVYFQLHAVPAGCVICSQPEDMSYNGEKRPTQHGLTEIFLGEIPSGGTCNFSS